MKKILFAFMLAISMPKMDAAMMHRRTIESEWTEDNLPPFDELMLSWNADRPSRGKYLFYVRALINEWSPWLLYASWGSDGQTSFINTAENSPVRVYQDALEILENQKATGFQIRIDSEGDAALSQIHGLHVYINSDKTQEPQQAEFDSQPIYLSVKGLSQITLNHIRNTALCSPTSTTAVVRYLSNSDAIDPIQFAQNVWDGGFDLFGNWVFNVAQAAAELGPTWNCWVERLSGLNDIYQRLLQGLPIIVSVRGPLPGSAQPYAKGHLIAVIGCDPNQQKVICMDPAFPTDLQTHVFYDQSDFLQAWSRRGRVAYIFSQN